MNTDPTCTCGPPAPTTPSGHRLNCPDWQDSDTPADIHSETDKPICGAPHATYPETLCTELPLHRMPHAGPLIINGRHCGGAAWGPDHGTAPRTSGRTETGATTATTQATGPGAGDTAADTSADGSGSPEPGAAHSGQTSVDLNTPDVGSLRDRIAQAIEQWTVDNPLPDLEADAGSLTDAVLAVVPPLLAQTVKERDFYGRETDRLRRDWETMRTRAETAEAERDAALGMADADSRQLAEVDARCDTAEARLRALTAGQNSLVSRPISPAVDGAETRVVRVAVTSPTAEDAESWARSVADMVIGEFADVMRLDVSVDGVPVPVEEGGQ